jgi:transposase
VTASGAFWYCTYEGALNAELFVVLLRRMMRNRSKPVHLVVDGLPAHKTALVKAYVASTDGRLPLHFLPGYAPDLTQSLTVHFRILFYINVLWTLDKVLGLWRWCRGIGRAQDDARHQ